MRPRQPGLKRAMILGSDHLTRHRTYLLALTALGYSSVEIASITKAKRDTVGLALRSACRAVRADSPAHAIVVALDAGYFRYGRAGYAGPDLQTCTLSSLRKELFGVD